MLKGKGGFTLLEILIVIIITGITLPVVGTAFYMLLRTPSQQTNQLAVLNDVNLVLNWIHDDINRGQYFAGDPKMLKSVYTVDFSAGAGGNQSAWSKIGEPASPADRGTPCPNYSVIAASDNYRWVTSGASSEGQLDTQMFQFTVPSLIPNCSIDSSPPELCNQSKLSSIVVSWKGNSSFNATEHHTKVKIWDYSGSGSWRTLADEAAMITEGWLSGRVTFSNESLPSRYIQNRKMYFLAETPYHIATGCPGIYSWNGTNYRFMEAAAIGKVYPRLSGMDYEPTTGLVPKDGYYDLMIYEPALETSGFDQLGLWAVEHPEGTQIVTDGSGIIHTISDLRAITAVDSYGRDVTDLLSTAGDDARWESNLSVKDFSNVSQLDDWIILTLPPDTPREGTVKLVVDTAWAPITELEQWYYFVYNLGSPNHDELIQQVDTWEGYENGSFAAFADMLLYDCSAFRVEVWNGSEWVYNTEVSNMGDKGHNIALIDLSQVTNNQLRIRLPAIAYTIDYVGVDWTEDENVTVTELPLADATKHFVTDLNVTVTQDALEAVSALDGSFATLNTGDYINYRFAALDKGPAEGMTRSFVLTSCGYYTRTGPEVDEDKSYNWELQNRFTYEPYVFRQMMYQIFAKPTDEINTSIYVHYEQPPFPTDMGSGGPHSLYTNYIKAMLLMPFESNQSTMSNTTYGGFYWVDRINASSNISYTTHYFYIPSNHQLVRQQWEDNNLVSTNTMAYNIESFDNVSFDFNPAGTSSTNDTLPYVVVDIWATSGQGDMYSEAHGYSHLALRSITMTQGMAVLTTQGVGTGKDSILISGRRLFIDGSMRALGNITVTGEDNLIAGNLVDGPAEAAGYIVDKGGAIAQPLELQTLGSVDWGGLTVTDFVDNASLPASNEFIWSGDTNLSATTIDMNGKAIWDDAPTNTVLKSGVYYSVNGNISLATRNVSGMVTLVSAKGGVTVTSLDSSLSPFCNGVLLFSNASYDDAIRFSGNGGAWSGSLLAPYGGVLINGSMTKSFYLFGSVGAQRFNYSANYSIGSNQTFMIKF